MYRLCERCHIVTVFTVGTPGKYRVCFICLFNFLEQRGYEVMTVGCQNESVGQSCRR